MGTNRTYNAVYRRCACDDGALFCQDTGNILGDCMASEKHKGGVEAHTVLISAIILTVLFGVLFLFLDSGLVQKFAPKTSTLIGNVFNTILK